LDDDLINSPTIRSTKCPNRKLVGKENSKSLDNFKSDKLKAGNPVIDSSKVFALNTDAMRDFDFIGQFKLGKLRLNIISTRYFTVFYDSPN
jgi:hypothetical protein